MTGMAKRISVYSLLTALCLVFGYVESLLPLSFIAPGIKLGLANSVSMLLVFRDDIKGAFAVNITRILLSSLLFATPFALIFSLTAGIISLTAAVFVKKIPGVSVIGVSAAGAAVHNTVQTAAASLIFGAGVWYYLPVLLIAAAVSGTAMGALCMLILKKVKTNGSF